jgi:uncharacterized membrane protein
MWKDLLTDLVTHHRGKVLGSLIGLVLALMVIRFGILWTIFIALCVAVGYFVGKRFDDDKDDLVGVFERLWQRGR